MDEVRLIDANALMARFFRKERLVQGAASAAYRDAQKTVVAAPTVSPWREASCPPPTHVDEWDDGQNHYRFELSDEVWIYCIDGTRLLGRYDKENGWFESNGPQISSQNHGSVTHWMPLPEAPKGVA